jgi:PAS domain-containing protein
MTMPDPHTALLLVAIGLLSALTALGLAAHLSAPRPVGQGRPAPDGDLPYLVFEGGKLLHANAAGLMLIGAPVAEGAAWPALIRALEPDFAGVARALDAMMPGAPPLSLSGECGRLLLARRDGSRLRIRIDLQAATAPDDTSRLRGIAAAMPCLAWAEASDGRVLWANPAYRALALKRGEPDAGANLFRDLSRGVPAGGSVRCLLDASGRAGPAWFDLYPGLPGDGERLGFAIPADPVVKAETALRQFVQALTQIFAHLPIGLAVFDRDRRLAMFNPALSDLTGLKPDFLSERPDFRAFLDRLRDGRMLPEQRDYASWRQALVDMEKAAQSGTYEENWDLVDGRTFRVTGRPHPDGALAFLIEDITPALSLQRQFRAEIDLGQSLIDATSDAIAVFTAEGDLSMTNAAFVRIFGIDPSETVAGQSIQDVIDQLRQLTAPSALWSDLLQLAQSRVNRAPVEGTLRLSSGRIVQARFLPLTHGATLCRFQTRDVPALPQRRAAGA